MVVGTDDAVDGGVVRVHVPAPDTSSAYKRWASSGARPKDIPLNPVGVYGRRGEWGSWDDFLGRRKGEVVQRGRPLEGPGEGAGAGDGEKNGIVEEGGISVVKIPL